MNIQEYRFEVWSDWLKAFYGCHKSLEEILPLIVGAMERGDFFTLHTI